MYVLISLSVQAFHWHSLRKQNVRRKTQSCEGGHEALKFERGVMLESLPICIQRLGLNEALHVWLIRSASLIACVFGRQRSTPERLSQARCSDTAMWSAEEELGHAVLPDGLRSSLLSQLFPLHSSPLLDIPYFAFAFAMFLTVRTADAEQDGTPVHAV